MTATVGNAQPRTLAPAIQPRSAFPVNAMSVALPAGFPVEGRTVPLVIEADQAYYWSTAWQSAAKETVQDLVTGDFVRFESDDPTDVARWLAEEEE